MNIPFNKPVVSGNELEYMRDAINRGKICGDGYYTKKCSSFMEKTFNAKKVLLTTSCTHALEMAAMLINVEPGDEIIVPSYTFVSTVNAFILRGGIPVFVDIRPDTLNIDEKKIEEKITKRTKAIFVVHYAGVACEMDTIMEIAKRHNLFVIEDAAQGVFARYKNSYLGTIGDIGTYSFHETKNYYCGEGGAIVINNERFIERSEIIREKGTDRSKFFRGEVDKYTWVDIGSSYLISDILAAFLFGQLEKMETIFENRKNIYTHYMNKLEFLQKKKVLRLPTIPKKCESNYHMFYIILPDKNLRNELMDKLRQKSIISTFHYIPLHLSPMGTRLGNQDLHLPITEAYSDRLLRLPFYNSLTTEEQDYVISQIFDFFGESIK